MIAKKPIPFSEAINLLTKKNLMPTNLDSAQLEKVSSSIKRQSMFSAKVANTTFLQETADKIARMIEPQAGGGSAGSYMDATKFREEMRTLLKQLKYQPPTPTGNDMVDSIRDLRSQARLDLIVTTNTELAQGFGQFIQGTTKAALDAFPCQELFRLEVRDVPRDWDARWSKAGGRTYNGRYIAVKGDRIWTDISRFGNPYPPFDYNSGMWVKDVPRHVAESLGVIRKGTKPVVPMDKMRLNTKVGSSLSPDMIEVLRQTLSDVVQQELM